VRECLALTLAPAELPLQLAIPCINSHEHGHVAGPVVTKSDVFHSLRYMRGDDTDDIAGFQALLADVRANGAGHIVMQKPAKRYRFVASGQRYPGQDFPSNTQVYGEPDTEVHWTGAPKIDDSGGKAGTQRYGWLK